MRSTITKINPHFRLYIAHKNISFLLMVIFFLSTLIYANNVIAQGVAAGTDIENIVIINYSVAGTVQDPIESSPSGNSVPGSGNGVATAFMVDRKIDLLLTGNTNANVAPGDSQAEVTFTLQNEGNATQEFSLIPDYTLSGDNYDTNNCNVEITGVTGIPVSGVILPTTGNIKLSADQQASISVKCDIPLDNSGSPITTGDTSLIGLIATTEKNEDGSLTVETPSADTSLGIETVFSDNSGTDDSNRDAMHSARRTYIASSATAAPNLTLDKSIVSVEDSVGGTTAVTGSEVTYKIQINTTGVGTINNLVITDLTPTDMSYKLGSIKLNNATQSDANDGADNTDFGITTTETATINLGNITAGNQYEIQLTYIIN